MNELTSQFQAGHDTPLSRFQTEEEVIGGAYFLLNEIREHFRKNNFQLAEICLNYLEEFKMWEDPEKTKIRMRRDQITPDFLHEVRQLLAVKGFTEDNLLNKRSKHGGIEILYCAILVHDLGEDFNVLPADLYQHLMHEIGKRKGMMHEQNQIHYKDMARRVTNIMENMTMERKYTVQAINKALDKAPGSALTQEDLAIFLNTLKTKFNPVDTNAQGLNIIRDPKRHNQYVVSRYIRGEIRDWNAYLHEMCKDPFAILAKFFDRNEGLSTRIGKNFDVRAYARYLSMTEQSFSFDAIAERAAKLYPELGKAFKTLDSMMGVLYRIGRTYVNHHQDLNHTGSKGFSVDTHSTISFKGYFPEALLGYRKVPQGINPLSMILGRIRNSFYVGGGGENLDRILKNSIHNSVNEHAESRGIIDRMFSSLGQPMTFSL